MMSYLGRKSVTDTGFVKKKIIWTLLSYIKVVMSFITKMNLQGLLLVKVRRQHNHQHLRINKDLALCKLSFRREGILPPFLPYIINTQRCRYKLSVKWVM
jgi:hypothetical protein